MSHRISRRSAVGAASAAGSLALLVACSGGVNSTGGGDSSESASASQREDYSGEIKFENFDTSSGNFEPATREHPARNVPKPKKPDNLNEKSVESFYQNIAFILAGMQYLYNTADSSPLRESNLKGKESVSRLEELFKSQGFPDKTWGDFNLKISLDTPQPTIEGDNYSWKAKATIDSGTFYVDNGQAQDIPQDQRSREEATEITGTYQNGTWEINIKSAGSSASSSAGSGSSAGTGSGGGLGF